MNQSAHPLDVALLVALVSFESLVKLVCVIIALIQVFFGTGAPVRAASAPVAKPATPPAPPLVHPYHTLADELDRSLTVKSISSSYGIKRARMRKAQLVEAVISR